MCIVQLPQTPLELQISKSMATNQRQTCMKMFSTDLNSRSSAWDEATMQLDIPSELTNTHLPTYCEIDVVGPTSSQAVKAHLQLPEHVLQEFESDGHPVILHGTLHGLIRTQVDRYVAKQKVRLMLKRFPCSTENSYHVRIQRKYIGLISKHNSFCERSPGSSYQIHRKLRLRLWWCVI